MDSRWAVAAFLIIAGAEVAAQPIPSSDIALQACVEASFGRWAAFGSQPACVTVDGPGQAKNGQVTLERAVEGVSYDGGYAVEREHANRAREEAFGWRAFGSR